MQIQTTLVEECFDLLLLLLLLLFVLLHGALELLALDAVRFNHVFAPKRVSPLFVVFSIDSIVVSLPWMCGEVAVELLDRRSSSSWYQGNRSVTFSICFLSDDMDFLISMRTISRAISPNTQIPSCAANRSLGVLLLALPELSENSSPCLGTRSP